MGLLSDICSSILESAIVTDMVNMDNSDTITTTNSVEDWDYLFMPDPIAGGSDNVEVLYNN